METMYVKQDIALYVFDCADCGVVFGVPTRLIESRKDDGKSIYCPNGHSMSYHKTTADKLREQLEAEKKKLANAQFELMAAKSQAETIKKQKARLEKRIKNGVCPCCHRQFVQLTRHMKTKHPNYTE